MFLSIFRILAVIAIGWYLFKLARKKEIPFGFILSISLIFAGAIGNIIDSLFYGLIFQDSYGQVSAIFPQGGGYAGFLHGKVVDMFYFPLINGCTSLLQVYHPAFQVHQKRSKGQYNMHHILCDNPWLRDLRFEV